MGFQVKCVSRTWDLTSRNGDSVGTVGLMGFTGQREGGCFTSFCLVFWGWGKVRRGLLQSLG